jgi:hypothetical protein
MEAVPHVRKLVLAGGIAILATLGTSATAYGKGCSGNSNNPPSSVSQYVEQVPGACGSKAVSQGSQTRKVPKVIEQKIDQQGGDDATLLKEIVSSEKYGAPTQTKIKVKKVTVHKTKTKGDGARKILSDSERRSADTNPLAASVGVITDGSDGRLIALIVLMAAVAAIVVVSALRRRRVTR